MYMEYMHSDFRVIVLYLLTIWCVLIVYFECQMFWLKDNTANIVRLWDMWRYLTRQVEKESLLIVYLPEYSTYPSSKTSGYTDKSVQ